MLKRNIEKKKKASREGTLALKYEKNYLTMNLRV